MTVIYLVITEDSQAGFEAVPFASEADAVAFAGQKVPESAPVREEAGPGNPGDADEAMRLAGVTWHCRYGTGSSVRVVRADLEGGEVITGAELAALRDPGIQEAIAAARLAGPGGFRPRSSPAQRQYPDVTRLLWAPYREFGMLSPARENPEVPAVPVTIRAVGYRDNLIIIYWVPAELPSAEMITEMDAAAAGRLRAWLGGSHPDGMPDPRLFSPDGRLLFEAVDGGGFMVKFRA